MTPKWPFWVPGILILDLPIWGAGGMSWGHPPPTIDAVDVVVYLHVHRWNEGGGTQDMRKITIPVVIDQIEAL